MKCHRVEFLRAEPAATGEERGIAGSGQVLLALLIGSEGDGKGV